ncbi:MAG: polysaccharide biosynthesis protein [Sphaerochaeta sp.]
MGKRLDNKTRLAATRWKLVLYDILVMLISFLAVFGMLNGVDSYDINRIIRHCLLFAFCVFITRGLMHVYVQIWRYGGIHGYVRLMVADFIGFSVFFVLSRLFLVGKVQAIWMVAFVCIDLLGVLVIRMLYRYAFKYSNLKSFKGSLMRFLLRLFAGINEKKQNNDLKKINVAIVGAGNIGVSLAHELMTNKDSIYEPRCFIDVNKKKVGREIFGLKVFMEDANLSVILNDYSIQQVIFSVPNMDLEQRKNVYEFFRKAGCKIMLYDAPQMESADSKLKLREFSIEELLFRRELLVVDDRTKAYYRDKVILVTGGGGSIGSEICRQLAEMSPRKLIILDIYENNAYDIQQELKIKYKGALDIEVEICSITNKVSLDRVFEAHRPDIVINAAAHKHVPLMEHNCIEAIENNVFGCMNVVKCCEEYGAARFMMVSTDKAVNPTNVMGATKRMCEMIIHSASTTGKVKYSATRFGNVLGSAGSVIPLFKKQIAEGGPVTITDKRIIRYFMTIPEASQLVLASGAMANNGELFVLDMGEPVKILDLAETMIRLTGARNVEIIETGLRPGEKLYEELLVNTEELDKTDNKLIFIERDKAVYSAEIEEKLQCLRDACASGSDEKAREALRLAVPTFKRPEEVNSNRGLKY